MKEKMEKIIVTGSNGLIGTKFVQTYKDKYLIVPFDLNGELKVDITDERCLDEVMNKHSDAKALLHLAAYTDVNGAHEQSGNKSGVAWQVNVEGTKNLIKLAQKYKLYFIHMSTAYVFDGEKPSLYFEENEVKPIEWYGKTKAEAEKIVTEAKIKKVVLRIDQPFSSKPFSKIDTLHRIIEGLEKEQLYPQFTNHYFGPTYIEDLVKVIDFCIRKQIEGIYHASSGEKWSDYDFAWAVKEILNLPGKIKKGDVNDYLKTLKRPYQKNTAMNNEKLRQILDFDLKTIKEAIKEKVKE